MFCPTCGRELPEGSRFCPGCGEGQSGTRRRAPSRRRPVGRGGRSSSASLPLRWWRLPPWSPSSPRACSAGEGQSCRTAGMSCTALFPTPLWSAEGDGGQTIAFVYPNDANDTVMFSGRLAEDGSNGLGPIWRVEDVTFPSGDAWNVESVRIQFPEGAAEGDPTGRWYVELTSQDGIAYVVAQIDEGRDREVAQFPGASGGGRGWHARSGRGPVHRRGLLWRLPGLPVLLFDQLRL